MNDRHTFNEPLIVDTRLDYSPNGWSTRYIVSCTCGWVVKHWLSDSSEAQVDSRERHFAESVGLWEVHMAVVRRAPQ